MIDDIDQVDCPNCGVSRRVLSGVVERCPICGDYGVELNQEEEYQCPCGCEDNVENCTYASICPQCKKKFYGNGYARRDQLCPECSPTQRPADECLLGGKHEWSPKKESIFTEWCYKCGTRR